MNESPDNLRIRPLSESVMHRCCICAGHSICHHVDLDFRTAGYVCDECTQPVINAEHALLNPTLHLCAPTDRALDQA